MSSEVWGPIPPVYPWIPYGPVGPIPPVPPTNNKAVSILHTSLPPVVFYASAQRNLYPPLFWLQSS